MKFLLFFLFILLYIHGFSQALILPRKSGKVFYEQVYHVTTTKNDLYLKSVKALVHLFPDAMDEIKGDDKENSTVYGEGNSFFRYSVGLLNTRQPQKFNFSIRITIEDNGYKLDIYNFYIIPIFNMVVPVPIESSSFMVKSKDNSYSKRIKLFDNMVKEVITSISNEINEAK